MWYKLSDSERIRILEKHGFSDDAVTKYYRKKLTGWRAKSKGKPPAGLDCVQIAIMKKKSKRRSMWRKAYVRSGVL
mgnify:CR=1 FL=1